jgi:YggT family protein
MGKIDTAAILAAIGIKAVEVFLIMLILGLSVSGEGAFKLTVGDILKTIIWIYIIALLVQAVMSWVGSSQSNPVAPLLHSLTEPIVRPIRQIVPTIGMIDLSPLVVILLLQVVLIFVRPLTCSHVLMCMVQNVPVN